ncbi:uncharacterized protein LOC133922728 isoform X2 [Phragmites australis]|uniref:uncharacterized protein LOC133922728 isoform X2 n=1 Tax=Phragmites australis TaxID=29695 RepID=UPI002D779D85|nr:uncharacterized protein LOC133922728 isoform X2 [Phragmites australis]
MATEEEAREATDGEEVQVEDVDLGVVHLQTHLDRKLQSNVEIKNAGEIIDSTEGTLKIPDDQVLVEAPSDVLVEASSDAKIAPEHILNGTASSLNGHMDTEEKISNEQLHENNQKDQEQVEAINEEVTDCLSHGESTTEDSSLLKHEKEEPKGDGQQDSEGATVDNDTVQEDTLKTENAVEQKVDGQRDQNLEPAEATKDTQPASMTDIPDVEVVAEAPAGAQTLVEPNLDDSDAVPDTIDENTETDEPVKADGVVHHDHKESFPEDTSIAQDTEEVEVVAVEDQQSKEADAMDADVVQEEMPNCEETDVQEEMSKPEHADELTADAQEVLNQESAEETNGPVNEKTEETADQSNMAASETMSEHDATKRETDVNIQVQNQVSLEEIEDAEAVDTEAEMQQSSVAFEEAIPEDHVATKEPNSDIQDVHKLNPEEVNGSGDAKDEEITNSNVALAEHAVQDKVLPSEPTADIQPVQELEQIETVSSGTYKMDGASDQTHAVAFNDLAQEDGIAASEPQVTDIAEELKDIDTTKTQETTQQGHVTPSKELSAEDDSTSEPHNDVIQQTLEQDPVEVKDTETHREKIISASEEDTVEGNLTAEEPTCDSQEEDKVEATEEIKDNKVDAEVSNVPIVDESDEGKNVLRVEDIAEKHLRWPEPEETNSTEPVETEKASDQRHTALFDDSVQEDNKPATEKQQMESAIEIKETEATKTEASPQESNVCVSEEPSPEDYITESETNCDTQEVNITESSEVIVGDKDIKTREISGQSNMVFVGESTQENIVPESEPTADIRPVQEPESEDMKNTELVEENRTSHELNATAFQAPTQEDNPTTIELHTMESAGEVSNIEAKEAQGIPHQSNADQSEVQATEENKTASEPQILEPESVEEMNDTEATKLQSISQQSIISTSEESVPEEIATEDNVITEPDVEHQQLQGQESAEFKETEANKPQEIASSSIVSTSEESTPEDNATAIEPNSDTQAENLQSAEVTEDTENAKSNTALAEEAAPEEHVETKATADISPVQEAELEETKDTEPVGTEDNMTSSDLPAEETHMETTETEAIPHESPAATVKELTEYDILTANTPHIDIQSVLELESVEDTKCTDTTEQPGEPQEIIGSTSDKLTPAEEKIRVTETTFDTQQVQNLTSKEIKNSEDANTDQFSDLSSFPTAEEANQESNLPRIEPTSDVQQVQELGSTEDTIGIEAVETEDHQHHRVSTLEETPVDSERNVDDQQVHKENPAEVEDNEAMEAEEVFKQSNITTPDNAVEERSELGSEPDFYVQPAQKVELSKDSEDSQLVKAEETSGQSNIVVLEETTTEDSVESEIDPTVDIKQEHEQESVEEIKGIDATEVEEDFHTSQADAIEKLPSESSIATIEPTYDIQQANGLEATKEMKGTEAIDDGEQTEITTSEDPSPTDNGTTLEEHPVEEKVVNETDNVMLVHGIKDEIQASTGLKDDACDLDETVSTTQRSENMTDDEAVQSSGDDTLETSNDIHQVKEEQKAVAEHNSSQMSQNITHIQDRDITEEVLTKRGTAEASQVLFGSDPQAAQDVTEKDDTIKCGEQTTDHDNRQPGDVALQLQTCEADALSIAKQDEAVQKVDLDQQQTEDEEIESQKEELQADEQKHEDKRDGFTTEPLVEPQNIENGTTNRTEDTDAFEAEQTEAVITEILKNERALHIFEESTPSITDMKVENVKGTDEGTEEDADAKNDNKDEQENAEKDGVVAKDSTDEHDDTADEITNEELEPGLASSVQEIADPASSKDQIENDSVAVPQNVESGVHREDKECTNKVNDDVHAIQASEKEVVDEVEENEEIQNEDNAVHQDESQTKPQEEEEPQLHFNEPYNAGTKIDDTTAPYEEIIHDNTSIQPREIKEIGESKGLNSISKPFVETSIQTNVEQDLSSHHKVEDEKLSTTEQNAVDIEAVLEKADESASDKIDETVSNEKTETSNTAATDAVTINEDITAKASGADGAQSDESLKTFNDTRRDLDVSSVITALKEKSMNENMEDRKLALPAQDENTPKQAFYLEETEREMSLPEKLLPTEPDEQDENQIPKEQDEEDKQKTEIGDGQKEVEQDLPVSHFLMNIILGKEYGDANGNSESEAERKQEETTEDNSCLIISKQEESLVSLPTENKVDDKLTFEEEKHEVKCSKETQELVKEQSHDLKLDTERFPETDEELNKNTHDLEIPAYQGNSQDEISDEMSSSEEAGVATKMETRDTEISELDDRAVDTICEENMEASTKVENGSSTNNLNDLTNTKASEEDTLEEGQTGPLCESLPEDKSADAVSEQTPLLTESVMIDEKDLLSDAESVQNPMCAKQVEATESFNIEATSTPDIQLESEEVDKKEEKHHASTATGEASEEHVESSHDNLQQSTSPEATSDVQAPQITKPVSDTEMTLAQEKEISEGSTCMDEKENSNFLIKGVQNFQTAVEIQADGPNMQINQDKQDEAADNETAMGPKKLGESNLQEDKETVTEQKSHSESDEGDQQFSDKKETVIKEEDVHETVQRHMQTVNIKPNEEKELFDSKVQERDLNVVSPREAPEHEEDFVDVTKPEFSTDEEQSPKADESNMAEEKTYDEKTKDEEETKKFTDEATMKTEAREAGQKVAHKKHSLLSGVGSKVKHQLAKVKKAIVGKPGHTKPESPKS